MKALAASQTGNATTRKFLALCGLVGPVIYAFVVAVLGGLYPGYSHLTQAMSELGAAGAPHSLIMNMAGLGLLGAMILAFAAGLHQSIRQHSGTTVGAVLIGASGLSLVMTAIFPCDTGGETTTSGMVHGAFAVVGVVCMIVGMLIISLVLAEDSHWQRYAIFTVATALLASALAVLYGFDVIVTWKGALQRISMGVALLWVEVMSFKLLRLT